MRHRHGETPSIDPQAIAELPPTLTIAQAAELLGKSRSAAYEAVAAAEHGEPDAWPVPVVRVGGRLRVPTKPVLDLLGLEAPLARWLRPEPSGSLLGEEN